MKDHFVPQAVKAVIPEIEKAVEAVIEAFKQGGRLIYGGWNEWSIRCPGCR